MSFINQGISPSDLTDARRICDSNGWSYEQIGFHWDETTDRWELWFFPPEAIAAGAIKVAHFNTDRGHGCWEEV